MLDNQDLTLEITRAVEQAVIAMGQDETLSSKIIAWFTALSLGNESLGNQDSVQRHMDLLLQHIKVDVNEGKE